jgi:hypothetical protein
VASWLEDLKYLGVNAAAQDIRPADEGSYKEIFKYFTKLITGGRVMPAAALDHIFRSLSRKRIFYCYNLSRENDNPQLPPDDKQPDSAYYTWRSAVMDWVNNDGEYYGGLTRNELIAHTKTNKFMEV